MVREAFGDDFLIGVSTHTIAEAARARDEVTLKDMRSGGQQTIERAGVAAALAEVLRKR